MAFGKTRVGKAVVDVEADASGVGEQVEKEVDKQSGRFGSTGKKIGLALGAAAVAGVALAAPLIGGAISKASDLNESVGKTQVVFGESAGAIEKWADTAATSIGQSKQQALEAAGTYGNLFSAFGIGKDKAADMSTSLTGLAADLASFNNTSVADALQALQSGVSGETEPLKRYGIAINDVRLKAEAARLGLVKSTVDTNKLSLAQETLDKATRKQADALKKNGDKSVEYADATRDVEQATSRLSDVMEGTMPASLDAATKAQASYSLIMNDTKLAQGDFARTSDGLANQQRILSAQWDDAQAKIGQKLLPVVLALVSFANEHLIPALSTVGETIRDVSKWVSEHKEYVIALGIGIAAALVPAFVGWAASAAAAAAATIAAAAPVIAIGVAIAALAAGVIYAYQHWDWFRTAVDKVGDAVQWVWGNVIKPFAGWLSKDFVDKLELLGRVMLGVFTGGLSEVALAVHRHWDDITSFVEGLPGKIGRAASGMWDGIKDAFRSALNWIIDRWNGLEFKVPGVEAFGHKIGGFTMGVPDIPRFGQGALVKSQTLAWVGENRRTAPEIVSPVATMYDTTQRAIEDVFTSSQGGAAPLVAGDLVLNGDHGDSPLEALDRWWWQAKGRGGAGA